MYEIAIFQAQRDRVRVQGNLGRQAGQVAESGLAAIRTVAGTADELFPLTFSQQVGLAVECYSVSSRATSPALTSPVFANSRTASKALTFAKSIAAGNPGSSSAPPGGLLM